MNRTIQVMSYIMMDDQRLSFLPPLRKHNLDDIVRVLIISDNSIGIAMQAFIIEMKTTLKKLPELLFCLYTACVSQLDQLDQLSLFKIKDTWVFIYPDTTVKY